MKRVLAVLILFSIILTAMPSLAAKQKSIPSIYLEDGSDGLFVVYQKDSDRNYLYDEDGKLVLESPRKGVYFSGSSVRNPDGTWESHLVVDGKCVEIKTYDDLTGRWKYGLVSNKGKVLCDCIYDEIWGFSEGIAKVSQDGKTGYIDTSGKSIVKCKYDDTYSHGDFNEGIALVKKGEKYGYINTSGKLISKCQWNSAGDFKDGAAFVEKGGKYGYINTNGELISDSLWYRASRLNNGLFIVEKGDKSRLLNKKGKVISKSYSYVMRPPIDGYLAVESSDGWGVINSKGKEVIECQYSYLDLCGEGIVNVSEVIADALMTMDGKILIMDGHNQGKFNEGLLIIDYRGKDGKYHLGAMNKKGKVVLDFGRNIYSFTSSYGFKNGLCFLTQDSKKDDPSKSTWGFMNKKGKWSVELKTRKYEPVFERDAQWDKPVWLSNKMIKIRSLGSDEKKYGMMNTKGKLILKCEWDVIEAFVDGLAYVSKDGKSGYVNTKGEMVISCDYKGTSKNSLVVVHKGGNAACFNKKGKAILPAKYKSIVIGDKVIAALKDEKILFFDLKGKPIMEEETPVVTPAPVKEEVPAAETTPAEETAPAQEEAPAENTDPPADTGEAA